MNKNQILKKFIISEVKRLMEEMEEQPVLTSSIDIILNKFPSLKSVIIDFLTSEYKDYIKDIFVVAPKPTTFKIILFNKQHFFLIYGPKSYTAKISGRKYYLLNLGEQERAIQAVANLLEMGNSSKTEGPNEETSPSSSSTPEISPEELAKGEEETVPPEA